jgi:hypothetical protein
VLVRAFDLAGFIPLERGNPEQSLPAIDRAADALETEQLVSDFSRGDAEPDGRAAPFKKGGSSWRIKGSSPRRSDRHHACAQRLAQGTA